MTGDSAAATLWRHRWLWLGFVRRDITSRYLGSVGGMAWALLHPLALLAILRLLLALTLLTLPLLPLLPLLHAGMAAGMVSGEFLQTRWTDVGTPERLADLNREEQARLQALCARFLADKEFHGAQGLAVSDAMALAVAAQACLPLLYWGPDALDW